MRMGFGDHHFVVGCLVGSDVTKWRDRISEDFFGIGRRDSPRTPRDEGGGGEENRQGTRKSLPVIGSGEFFGKVSRGHEDAVSGEKDPESDEGVLIAEGHRSDEKVAGGNATEGEEMERESLAGAAFESGDKRDEHEGSENEMQAGVADRHRQKVTRLPKDGRDRGLDIGGDSHRASHAFQLKKEDVEKDDCPG